MRLGMLCSFCAGHFGWCVLPHQDKNPLCSALRQQCYTPKVTINNIAAPLCPQQTCRDHCTFKFVAVPKSLSKLLRFLCELKPVVIPVSNQWAQDSAPAAPVRPQQSCACVFKAVVIPLSNQWAQDSQRLQLLSALNKPVVFTVRSNVEICQNPLIPVSNLQTQDSRRLQHLSAPNKPVVIPPASGLQPPGTSAGLSHHPGPAAALPAPGAWLLLWGNAVQGAHG
eukprot:scaffold283574_cov19-Tisochrysis_lutea.AAC.1